MKLAHINLVARNAEALASFYAKCLEVRAPSGTQGLVGRNSVARQWDCQLGSMLSEITRAGSAQIGEITDFGTAEKPFLIAYARDPEGNVLELEQT